MSLLEELSQSELIVLVQNLREETQKRESEIASFREWLTYLIQNAPIPSDEAVGLIFEKFIEKFPKETAL